MGAIMKNTAIRHNEKLQKQMRMVKLKQSESTSN